MRCTLLRAPNDLKPYFPALFYIMNSFLKLVYSYRPFRRRKKTSHEHKSENPVLERNSRLRWAMLFLIADSESTQKGCIYSDIFGIKIRFWWKLHTKSCFWSKSCFCCSRTADCVSRTFDTRFGKFRVESTWGEMEFGFFYPMWDTPFPKLCPKFDFLS